MDAGAVGITRRVDNSRKIPVTEIRNLRRAIGAQGSAAMNRVKEYITFTVWFVGLGYIALWPLTAHDNDIARLSADLICGEEPLEHLNWICNPSHALHLSPGLHLIGLMSAVCVVVRVLLRRLRRSRRRLGAETTAPEIASRIPAVLQPLPRAPRPARREPMCSLRPVRPRKDFGLRGVPH